jgi:phospholipid transport system transporter-binding protein
MLKLPATLTQAQAGACLATQLAALRAQAGDTVRVDASQLNQFDSSALAVLLEFRREAQALGKGFAVQGLPPRLANLAVLYGVEALIPPG